MSDNSEETFPNILIVDNNENVSQTVKEYLSELVESSNEQIMTASSKEEALRYFEYSEKTRQRIHLLISDIRIPGEETGISLIEKVRQMTPHPYTVGMSGFGDTNKIKEITDDFLQKPNDITDPERYKKILADCEAHWRTVEKTVAEAERVGSQTPDMSSGHRCAVAGPPGEFGKKTEDKRPDRFPSIPPPPSDEESDRIISPFPPLKKFDTHNPLKIEDESLPLALFDLDGTLTRTSTRDVILLSGFVRHLYETNPGFGNKDLWKDLMERFENWLAVELGTKKTDIHGFYEEQIQSTSKIFGLSLAGAEKSKVEKSAKDYIKERLSAEKSPFYDYTKPIIKHTSELGIYSTIITGSPDFLVKLIANELEIPFYFGMEFETEKRKTGKNGEEFKEFFTGDVRYITGGKEAKKKVCDKLPAQGHVIVFGMGNSDADEPLLKASLASREPHDFHGSSILVNPGKRDNRYYGRYCYSETLSDQITVVQKESEAVVRTYRHKLSDVLSNERNIKKARDVLLNMKQDIDGGEKRFTLDEVVQRLRDFYGYEAVYNTLQLNLGKIHLEYLMHALNNAGVPEGALIDVEEALRYYQETGKPLEKDEESEDI